MYGSNSRCSINIQGVGASPPLFALLVALGSRLRLGFTGPVGAGLYMLIFNSCPLCMKVSSGACLLSQVPASGRGVFLYQLGCFVVEGSVSAVCNSTGQVLSALPK